MTALQPAISWSALLERQSSQSSARADETAASRNVAQRIALRRKDGIKVPPAMRPCPAANLHGSHIASNVRGSGAFRFSVLLHLGTDVPLQPLEHHQHDQREHETGERDQPGTEAAGDTER